jgi:hypothetical protein
MLLAGTALTAGVLGELVSSELFRYGASIEGVIAVQMLSIGLFLLGIYVALGLIAPFLQLEQSLGVPSSSDGTGRRGAIFKTLLFIAALAAVFASVPSAFPDPNLYSAIMLLLVSSLLAAVSLIVITGCLRIGTDRHYPGLVGVSSVSAILIALLWAITQRAVYAILLEYLGHMTLSDYIIAARLSSLELLVVSLCVLYPVSYYFIHRSPGIAEIPRETEQAPA